MNPAKLVRELLSLPHAQRVRRLVEVGVQARTDPAIAALLARWEKGDWQERTWSLTACWGSQDGGLAFRLAADPSRSVGGLAIRLLAAVGEDEQALQALRTLPTRRRRGLFLQLRRRRRSVPIDTFVRELQARGDPQALQYQDFTVGGDFLDPISWQRRASTHPVETASHFLGELEAARQPDGLLLRATLAALRVLSVPHPDLALNLVRSLRRQIPLGQLPLRPLLYRRPAAVADLVLSADSPVPVDFAPVVRRLDLNRLLALLERQPATLLNPVRWLCDLAPADRAAIFRQCGAAWRDGDGCMRPELLALLPADLRDSKARRHLSLTSLTTRPLLRAAYFAGLPWDEARDGLRGWFQHPEAEMRAAAWQALTAAARYHSSRLGELLSLLRQRKHEQDPVRLVFLSGLANLPPRRWTTDLLPNLAGVIREALDATDLSPISTHTLARLLWQLLPHQPAWTVEQLALLFRERGAVFCLALQDRLTDVDARRIDEALASVTAAWTVNNRGGWLVWMASCLGCRLRVCTRILTALRGVVAEDRDHLAVQALELLRRHLPRREFDGLVAELVKRDRTWAAITTIFHHLYLHRQDLVEPFLGRPYVAARRGQCDLIHLLPRSGSRRLTSPQQKTLGRTLASLMQLPAGTDLPRDAWSILLALDHLARLPAADHGRISEMAVDKRLLIRDAALRALGRLDAGEGLPLLLEALDDDRARVAIYAVRAAMMDLPTDRVLTLLRAVPMQKVTVAKETLRLAGELAGPAAFGWLEELAGRDLHRDVRIALLRALWDHLERPAASIILNQAAADPDGRLLNGVLRIPADKLTATARARLIDLLLGLMRHGDATVRVAVLQRFAQLPVPDPDGRLLDQALALLSSPLFDERSAATQAVVASATAVDANRLRTAMTRLLPERKPLAEWLGAVTRTTEIDRERLAPVARAVLAVLQTDSLTVCFQPLLAVAADGVAGLRGILEALRVPPYALHADALRSLESAVESCAHLPDRARLEELEAELAGCTDDRLRRLAVTALGTAARDGRGWTAIRRDRLQHYRSDTAPLVAGAALFTFPPEESATPST